MTKTDVNLQMINGDSSATAGGLEYALELMVFAESLARRDEAALTTAREALASAAGSAVLVDAAAVAGNFQRMVRIADAAGIPLDERNIIATIDIREQLDLQRFGSAANSRSTTLSDRLKAVFMKPLMKFVMRRIDRKANTGNH
ncbi:hypothetical protein EYC98_05185 [Halieaceae bacterium IMCC14734]|nr:hypothetical protein [Candidatus Litorirhabdus singularis]